MMEQEKIEENTHNKNTPVMLDSDLAQLYMELKH